MFALDRSFRLPWSTPLPYNLCLEKTGPPPCREGPAREYGSIFVHQRIRFHGPSRQGGRPDQRRHPRSSAWRPTRSAGWPAKRWSPPTWSWSPAKSPPRPTCRPGRRRSIVRDTVREIGYVDPTSASRPTPARSNAICTRSRRDIAMGVDTGGAGDQGMMFGFACDETQTLMPLPIYLAHRLVENHAELRRSGELKFVRPDAKSQVTVEYNADGTPHRIHTVVLSTQHDESVVVTKDGQDYFSDEARKIIIDKLILPTLMAERPDLLKGDLVMMPPGPAGREIDGRRHRLPHQPDRLLPGRRSARRLRADRAARSSWTPTAAGAGTAAAPSAARTRPRWIARPPTWPATSPRTSWPPAWPASARCSSATPSATPTRSTSGSAPTARPLTA